MSLLFDLPDVIIDQILSQWLPFNDFVHLDSALCNSNNRQQFLKFLTDYNDASVDKLMFPLCRLIPLRITNISSANYGRGLSNPYAGPLKYALKRQLRVPALDLTEWPFFEMEPADWQPFLHGVQILHLDGSQLKENFTSQHIRTFEAFRGTEELSVTTTKSYLYVTTMAKVITKQWPKLRKLRLETTSTKEPSQFGFVHNDHPEYLQIRIYRSYEKTSLVKPDMFSHLYHMFHQLVNLELIGLILSPVHLYTIFIEITMPFLEELTLRGSPTLANNWTKEFYQRIELQHNRNNSSKTTDNNASMSTDLLNTTDNLADESHITNPLDVSFAMAEEDSDIFLANAHSQHNNHNTINIDNNQSHTDNANGITTDDDFDPLTVDELSDLFVRSFPTLVPPHRSFSEGNRYFLNWVDARFHRLSVTRAPRPRRRITQEITSLDEFCGYFAQQVGHTTKTNNSSLNADNNNDNTNRNTTYENRCANLPNLHTISGQVSCIYPLLPLAHASNLRSLYLQCVLRSEAMLLYSDSYHHIQFPSLQNIKSLTLELSPVADPVYTDYSVEIPHRKKQQSGIVWKFQVFLSNMPHLTSLHVTVKTTTTTMDNTAKKVLSLNKCSFFSEFVKITTPMLSLREISITGLSGTTEEFARFCQHVTLIAPYLQSFHYSMHPDDDRNENFVFCFQWLKDWVHLEKLSIQLYDCAPAYAIPNSSNDFRNTSKVDSSNVDMGHYNSDNTSDFIYANDMSMNNKFNVNNYNNNNNKSGHKEGNKWSYETDILALKQLTKLKSLSLDVSLYIRDDTFIEIMKCLSNLEVLRISHRCLYTKEKLKAFEKNIVGTTDDDDDEDGDDDDDDDGYGDHYSDDYNYDYGEHYVDDEDNDLVENTMGNTINHTANVSATTADMSTTNVNINLSTADTNNNFVTEDNSNIEASNTNNQDALDISRIDRNSLLFSPNNDGNHDHNNDNTNTLDDSHNHSALLFSPAVAAPQQTSAPSSSLAIPRRPFLLLFSEAENRLFDETIISRVCDRFPSLTTMGTIANKAELLTYMAKMYNINLSYITTRSLDACIQYLPLLRNLEIVIPCLNLAPDNFEYYYHNLPPRRYLTKDNNSYNSNNTDTNKNNTKKGKNNTLLRRLHVQEAKRRQDRVFNYVRYVNHQEKDIYRDMNGHTRLCAFYTRTDFPFPPDNQQDLCTLADNRIYQDLVDRVGVATPFIETSLFEFL